MHDAPPLTLETPSEACPRSVIDLIGNTPLLSFRRIVSEVAPVKVYAKAEWYNPGGSVKDRAALRMILDGERRGLLRKGMTILDATSGNTGIAYALIAAERGYAVKLALPKNASVERRQTLAAFGVELVLTDPGEGTDGAQRVAKELFAAEPDRYFYPDQYNNDSNWLAHYHTTGPEIWQQTGGSVTHFVAGLGTSGTFMGATRKLRELNPAITCVSMQPDSPLHGLEGMKHMATAMVPGIYDSTLADEQVNGSRPTTRTAWCSEWRAKRAFSSGRRRARTSSRRWRSPRGRKRRGLPTPSWSRSSATRPQSIYPTDGGPKSKKTMSLRLGRDLAVTWP